MSSSFAKQLGMDRRTAFEQLRRSGLGVNVHYIPVHLHPYYQEEFGTRRGDCPVAEAAYEEILSLPLFPAMTDLDIERVTETILGLHPTSHKMAA